VNDATRLPAQWYLASAQVFNWGPFTGYHRMDPAGVGEATLISGSSGTGKSSYLDATSALLHPGRMFNKASSGGGKARSIATYVRGVYDKEESLAGTRVFALRDKRATWSAIAHTWANLDGESFTVFSAYFMNTDDEKPSHEAHGRIGGFFDVRQLDAYTRPPHVPLHGKSLRAAFPSMVPAKTKTANLTWLADKLGLASNLTNLMDILYRIQASQEIPGVDWLFTNLVLDEPTDLLASVGEAREFWDKVREARKELYDRQRKAEILKDLLTYRQSFETNANADAFFQGLGYGDGRHQADTPFWRWVREREFSILDELEPRLAQGARDATAAVSNFQIEKDTADAAALNAQIRYLKAGGAEAASLETDIRSAEGRVSEVRTARAYMSERVGAHLAPPSTLDELTAQRAETTTFLGTVARQLADIAEPLRKANGAEWDAQSRLTRLRKERAYYANRKDLIPQNMAARRDEWAELTGIPAADLKFVGELMDVEPEFEEWRDALEGAVGGWALTLLVPEENIREFRRKVNHIKTPPIIHSQAVSSGTYELVTAPEHQIAGRVFYAEHRYAGWLSQEVARRFTHKCVEDGEGLNQLADGTWGVSKSGQVRGPKGTGKHGGAGRRNIGFSPHRLLEELDVKIAEADSDAVKANEEAHALKQAQLDLTQAQAAHEWFQEAIREWHRYDMVGAEQHLESLRRQRAALSSNNELDELEKAAKARKAEADNAGRRFFEAQDAAEKAVRRRDQVIDDKDGAERSRDMLRGRGVEEPDMERLDEEACSAFNVDELTHEHLQPGSLGRLAQHLRKAQSGAAGQKGVALKNIRDVMVAFNREYTTVVPIGISVENPDPETDYVEYARIRSQQTTDGLALAQEQFAQQVLDFTNVNVGGIADSYESQRRIIRDRINAINELLAPEPFGGDSTLSIQILRDEKPADTKDFLAQLGSLGSGATKGITYEAALERFPAFDAAMDMVATEKQVSDLFDVRRHMTIQARAEHKDGTATTYNHFSGEKSGGETQELTAFVLAAAVRYHVGTEGVSRPKFATVFLDEALIKADDQFTERAINVWLRFGFQPIIAAPVGKFEAATSATSLIYAVAKDDQHRSRLDFMRKVAGTKP
jgi:uncharacterized protein YPO0396